jgi:hypothetical protein
MIEAQGAPADSGGAPRLGEPALDGRTISRQPEGEAT